MTEPTAVTQAEFARILKVARSYVTALKKADRLVLNAIGNVLVDESIKRIAETSDPNRDDVLVDPDPVGHLRLEVGAGEAEVTDPGERERGPERYSRHGPGATGDGGSAGSSPSNQSTKEYGLG